MLSISIHCCKISFVFSINTRLSSTLFTILCYCMCDNRMRIYGLYSFCTKCAISYRNLISGGTIRVSCYSFINVKACCLINDPLKILLKIPQFYFSTIYSNIFVRKTAANLFRPQFIEWYNTNPAPINNSHPSVTKGRKWNYSYIN